MVVLVWLTGSRSCCSELQRQRAPALQRAPCYNSTPICGDGRARGCQHSKQKQKEKHPKKKHKKSSQKKYIQRNDQKKNKENQTRFLNRTHLFHFKKLFTIVPSMPLTKPTKRKERKNWKHRKIKDKRRFFYFKREKKKRDKNKQKLGKKRKEIPE